MAHVRAAIGSPVQETNCHPFRRGDWLFVHNGFLADFHLLRRDLMLAIDPDRFADVQGSTDTEVVFHLALTLRLEEDPIGALEATVGLIEDAGRRRANRWRSAGELRRVGWREPVGGALFHRRSRALSVHVDRGEAVRRLYPDNPRFQRLDGRGPPHRVGALLRPSRRVARGPASDSSDSEPDGVLEERPFRPRPARST